MRLPKECNKKVIFWGRAYKKREEKSFNGLSLYAGCGSDDFHIYEINLRGQGVGKYFLKNLLFDSGAELSFLNKNFNPSRKLFIFFFTFSL